MRYAAVNDYVRTAPWPDHVKLLVVNLLAYRNAKSGLCNPSMKRLADEMDKGEQTIRNTVKTATAVGAISVTKVGRSNHYMIHDNSGIGVPVSNPQVPVTGPSNTGTPLRTTPVAQYPNTGSLLPPNSIKHKTEHTEQQNRTKPGKKPEEKPEDFTLKGKPLSSCNTKVPATWLRALEATYGTDPVPYDQIDHVREHAKIAGEVNKLVALDEFERRHPRKTSSVEVHRPTSFNLAALDDSAASSEPKEELDSGESTKAREKEQALRWRQKYPDGISILEDANPQAHIEVGRIAGWAQRRFNDGYASSVLMSALSRCDDPVVPYRLDELIGHRQA